MYPAVSPRFESGRHSSAASSDTDSTKRHSIHGSGNLPIHTNPINGLSHPTFTTPQRPAAGGHSRNASAAIDNAFASEAEQPTIFPPSVYRTPPRSQSRPMQSMSRSSPSPAPMTASPPPPRASLDAGRLSPGEMLARDRSYSPMAASFARLSRKDDYGSVPVSRGLSGGSKSGVELEARLFAGPA